MPEIQDPKNETMIFHILRLIEEGESYTELSQKDYDSYLCDLLFRIRGYILNCKERRIWRNQHEKNI